jgi:TM2 domain-containing membrane protein YozV
MKEDSKSVFKELYEQAEEQVFPDRKYPSVKSRTIVWALAFFTPIGLHTLYLGNGVKAFVQLFILFWLLLFYPFVFAPNIIALYLAWLNVEGFDFLLWYKQKDSDDFAMYDKRNPPFRKRKTALLLAFYAPIGFYSFYMGKKYIGSAQFGMVMFWVYSWLLSPLFPQATFEKTPLFVTLSITFIGVVVFSSFLQGIFLMKNAYGAHIDKNGDPVVA